MNPSNYAQQALKKDPYKLLSFSGSWKEVDTLARTRFAVETVDSRRLHAAVEESLYRLLDSNESFANMCTGAS